MNREGRIPDFIFPEPLIEGVIVLKRYRFVVDVKIGDEVHTCHCPCTGRIAPFDLKGRPCLLSRAKGGKRKTQYTMEAFSMDEPEVVDKSWIGINQNAMNRYVEHYLVHGAFRDIVGDVKEIRREVFLGNSKIDFRVGDVFIEVKTPLGRLEIPIPDHIKVRKSNVAFDTSSDRFIKHLESLANSLGPNQRALFFSCFGYENDGMRTDKHVDEVTRRKVSKVFSRCPALESWQVNFEITNRCVRLIRYFSLDINR